MPKTRVPTQTRLVCLLNRNGLTDMNGQFYGEANAFNVVRLILKNVKLAPRKPARPVKAERSIKERVKANLNAIAFARRMEKRRVERRPAVSV